MKISICIPQYNRIRFLLKSLEIIALQKYSNIEIVISDDCSTDETEFEIIELQKNYKFPVVYHRNAINMGYDRNYRQCIELCSGAYALVIGNDDSLNPSYDIGNLAKYLEENDLPDIGFCNFIEESNGNSFVERAQLTTILGTGFAVAMKYYSCFSFVGGLIYKMESFKRYNSSKHDGSIYSQMYLGCLMVASGCTLFSIYEPYVIKDIELEKVVRNSYRDVLAKSWGDYKIETGGLPSVINVLISAFRDANVIEQKIIYSIFKRIYTITYPYWIIDYKSNGAFPASVGLIRGMLPSRDKNIYLLNMVNRIKIWVFYFSFSFIALIMPVSIFNKFKNILYKKLKGHRI